jgi:hypothetical protein
MTEPTLSLAAARAAAFGRQLQAALDAATAEEEAA